MLSWLAPIFVFGLVVLVHELGHFIAAKWLGVYAPADARVHQKFGRQAGFRHMSQSAGLLAKPVTLGPWPTQLLWR